MERSDVNDGIASADAMPDREPGAEMPLPMDGWLIVLGAFLVLYLLLYGAGIILGQSVMLSIISEMLKSGETQWVMAGAALIGVDITTCVSGLGLVYLLTLFFKKKKNFVLFFEKIFMAVAAANAVLALALFVITSAFDWKLVFYPLIPLLLWSQYLHKSERVKATFILS